MWKKAAISPARRRDRLAGLIIICVAFAGCLALSLWAKEATTPKPAPPPAPPTKAGLSGFPDQVEPWDLVERARAMTVRDLFQGFVARGVTRAGTLDFTKKKTELRYSFQSAPGMGPQPPREGGTLPKRTYCGKQSVRVSQHGMGARPDVTDLPCPGRDPRELERPENCSIEDVWEVAAKRRGRLPKQARIEYYRAQAGPAYRFVGGKHRFVLSAKDCSTILEGKKQRGGVP